MSDLNKVAMIGNVVHEPKRREEHGEQVTRFVLATTVEQWHGRTRRLSVDFHECRAAGKLGDIIAAYVRKASKVYVEGKLRTLVGASPRSRRPATLVEVENVIMLGHRSPAPEEAA